MSKSFEETGTGAQAFGERLRRERETRGISLEEIAATTKISKRLLRALEDGQFELLPGGIFNKSYVRAYARHLGIDEEQAVAGYLQAAHEEPPDVRLIAHQNSAMHDRIGANHMAGGAGFPVLPVLILVVVIAGGFGGWRLYRQRQRERALPPAVMQVGAHNEKAIPGPVASVPPNAPSENRPTSQPSATSADSSVVPTVQAAESSSNSSKPSDSAATGNNSGSQATVPFAVTVRAKERARVEVKSDGEIVARGIIEPSEVKTFHATNRLVFWTANADLVEISFNGKSLPLGGLDKGEQVLIFNSHGLLPRTASQ